MIAHHQFLLPQSHDFSPNQSLKTRKIILLKNGAKQDINNSINYEKGNQHKTTNFFASNLDSDNSAQNQKLKHQIADPPKFDPRLNYSREFWKMYLQNEIIVSEIRQSVVKSKETMSVIKRLETECKELEASLPGHSKRETKKKKRRTANEIKKSFVCPYQNCNKNYGSDVSLNLHIKLKHNGGNKTEREKLARDIFLAKINGEEQPEIKLNLPPGFLDNVNKTKLLKEKCTRRDKSVKSEKDSQNNLEENRSSESNISENIDTKESTEPIVMHEIKINEIPLQCGESS